MKIEITGKKILKFYICILIMLIEFIILLFFNNLYEHYLNLWLFIFLIINFFIVYYLTVYSINDIFFVRIIKILPIYIIPFISILLFESKFDDHVLFDNIDGVIFFYFFYYFLILFGSNHLKIFKKYKKTAVFFLSLIFNCFIPSVISVLFYIYLIIDNFYYRDFDFTITQFRIIFTIYLISFFIISFFHLKIYKLLFKKIKNIKNKIKLLINKKNIIKFSIFLIVIFLFFIFLYRTKKYNEILLYSENILHNIHGKVYNYENCNKASVNDVIKIGKIFFYIYIYDDSYYIVIERNEIEKYLKCASIYSMGEIDYEYLEEFDDIDNIKKYNKNFYDNSFNSLEKNIIFGIDIMDEDDIMSLKNKLYFDADIDLLLNNCLPKELFNKYFNAIYKNYNTRFLIEHTNRYDTNEICYYEEKNNKNFLHIGNEKLIYNIEHSNISNIKSKKICYKPVIYISID